MTLSKNEKSWPVAGGLAEVAVSRRESTSGQAESKILHRALKSQAPVVGSHISQIKLLYFKSKNLWTSRSGVRLKITIRSLDSLFGSNDYDYIYFKFSIDLYNDKFGVYSVYRLQNPCWGLHANAKCIVSWCRSGWTSLRCPGVLDLLLGLNASCVVLCCGVGALARRRSFGGNTTVR